jgi:hypothetical protein
MLCQDEVEIENDEDFNLILDLLTNPIVKRYQIEVVNFGYLLQFT